METRRRTQVDAVKAEVREAWLNLQHADAGAANFHESDLRGAHMRSKNLRYANLTGARYDTLTRWPSGFDPERQGAVKRE